MRNIIFVTSTVVLLTASGAHAQSNGAAPQASPGAASSPSPIAPNTEGVIRKVDKEQGKLTIKHGPIANLDMPGMTMVFKVSDPKAIEALKEGDKVRFFADKVNGALTVMAIEAAK